MWLRRLRHGYAKFGYATVTPHVVTPRLRQIHGNSIVWLLKLINTNKHPPDQDERCRLKT